MPTYLSTSSEYKLKEFRTFCQEVRNIKKVRVEPMKGPDLPEVMADSLTVALYKTKDLMEYVMKQPIFASIDSPTSFLCEDTILCKKDGNDWKEIVDIKWRLPEDNITARWQSILGEAFIDPIEDKKMIRLYIGTVIGQIKVDTAKPGEFGFERFFYPDECDKRLNLEELAFQGKKDLFSARKKAFDRWVNWSPNITKKFEDIEPWSGRYQHEEIDVYRS